MKRKGKKDLLLPYIPPVVLDVDVAAGRIEVGAYGRIRR